MDTTPPLPNIPAGSGADQPQPASRGRRWLFRFAALLLPVLLFAILEGALRLAGYGGHPPILAELGEVDGRRYIGTHPAGIGPFFSASPDRPGSMDRQVFTMPKDAGTVRIVIVGGSAAQGYPQPRPLKLSAFLAAMLQDVWPGKKVEVLNLGTTAVASFPAACIARDALRYDVDLLVVYSGNNEFYGAGGVASAHRLGGSARAMRTVHALKRLAIVQALPGRSKQDAPVEANENLMDAVFADAQIPPDDPRRAQAAENLADNIAWVIDAGRERNIPVMVCTCPGNERDMAPIGEDLPPPGPEADAQRFSQLLDSARSLRSGRPDEALSKLDEAARIHDKNAALHFLRGECLQLVGRLDEAARAYVRARDLDTMPWRSPSTSNAAIREVAGRGAVLCDLERAFQQASPGGAIGWELMDDHVHPSLAGQALIARTIVRTMQQLEGEAHVAPAAADALPDWEIYAQRLGENPLDAYRVVYRVLDLFERSFFKRSNPDALTRFQAMRRDMEAAMHPRTLATVQRLQATRSGVPITGAVAEAELHAGEYHDAAARFGIARRCENQYSYLAIRYGCLELEALRRGGAPPPGAAQFDELLHTCQVVHALSTNPTPLVDALQGWLLGRQGRHAEAIPLIEPVVRSLEDVLKPVLAGQLAASLVAMGRDGDARALLAELGLRADELALDDATAAKLAKPR